MFLQHENGMFWVPPYVTLPFERYLTTQHTETVGCLRYSRGLLVSNNRVSPINCRCFWTGTYHSTPWYCVVRKRRWREKESVEKQTFKRLYRTMLWISAVFAVSRCLSVCLSVTLVHCIQRAKNIVKLLSRSGSPVILLTPSAGTQFRVDPLQRGRKIQGVGEIFRFSTEIAVYLGNDTR